MIQNELAQSATVSGGSRALVISVRDYANLPCVESAHRSARDFADLLVERSGLAQSNLTLLQDPESVASIGSEMVSASEQATDVLLVYFVGHGLVHSSGELYLAYSGTIGQPSQISYTAIRYASLRESLLGSRASSIYVILDCCFAGRAIGALSSEHTLDSARVDGARVLAAAARDELALAPAGAEYTAFTGELIALMRDGNPGGGEFLTVRDVFRYLTFKLPAKGYPAPRMLVNQNAGDLIFCRNAATSAAPDELLRRADSTGLALANRAHQGRLDPELGQLVEYGGWGGFNPLPPALLEVDSRVPRTSEQLADLLNDRPPNWEPRLFAAVALQELIRLRALFAIHFNGPAQATGVEWSSQVALQRINESMDHYLKALHELDDAFENGRHSTILESEDSRRIEAHAVELVGLIKEFMNISSELRGARIKNRHLRRAADVLAHFSDQPIVSIVEFVQEYISRIDESGHQAMRGEDVNIHLRLTLNIPEVLLVEFRDAMGRY